MQPNPQKAKEALGWAMRAGDPVRHAYLVRLAQALAKGRWETPEEERAKALGKGAA